VSATEIWRTQFSNGLRHQALLGNTKRGQIAFCPHHSLTTRPFFFELNLFELNLFGSQRCRSRSRSRAGGI
jgi:hypothetical protein